MPANLDVPFLVGKRGKIGLRTSMIKKNLEGSSGMSPWRLSRLFLDATALTTGGVVMIGI
jgi:hypothetical protein